MLAAAGWTATSGAMETRTSDVFRLEPGDRIRVVGAPVGCRVKRMRQLGGRIAVDCRRGGPLEGTYGTLLTGREAVLLRFESSTTAKRIATGTHRRKVERCR
jgi:hypothetical protein